MREVHPKTRRRRKERAISMLQQLTRQVEVPGLEHLAGPNGIKQSVLNRDEALEMHETMAEILGLDPDDYFERWAAAWTLALKSGPKSSW